ncbi:MAG: RcnB family protein [Steroidobacteraceae bacterium]
MANKLRSALCLAAALAFAGASLAGEEPREGPRPGPVMHQGEPHPGPSGYQRVAEPHGWNTRPATVDRAVYQHNYQAARSYHIGPYHRPVGWHARVWAYGDVLPRAYWGPQYILSDYWLFALEVPPVGYEWVRVGNDALLVSTDNGAVLQVEYGVFA